MRVANKLIKKLKPAVPTLTALAITAAWALLTLFVHVALLRAAFSVAFLALAPGYFVLRTIIGYRKPASSLHIASYSLGLSLILLMLTGLAINQVMPLFDVIRPFSVANLTVAIAGLTTIFIFSASLRKRPQKPARTLRPFKLIAAAVPVVWPAIILPILAAGGAITLNNGGENWLALTAMGGVGAYFLILAWRDKQRILKWYPAALYGICLALLLGTSLRGWHITGHDVMQEYQVFELTLRHAAWHMQYYQDAYNACLSITILPTIFQKLTGISDPYIFKFVYQLLFAAIAPVLYSTLHRYTGKKVAFLAVFTFLTFPTFLTDMTMLNRQAIALLCLALSLQAGLDKTLVKWQKDGLVFLFLVGMILSHYSTSYVAVSVLGLAAVLMIGLRVGIRLFRKKKTGPKPKLRSVIYSPAVVIAALVVIFCWNTLATNTSGNISKTITATIHALPQAIHHSGATASTSTKQVAPKGTPLDQYLSFVSKNRNLPANAYYPNAIIKAAPIVAVKPVNAQEGSALRQLHVPTSLLVAVYDATRQVYALLIELLIVVGLIALSFKRKRLKLPPAQYIFLGIASLAVIVLQVILPSGAVDYGILRVIQQSLVLLSVPIILACFWLLRLVRIPEKWQPRVIAALLTIFFLILSGFISTLTGGYKSVLALSNSGFYYEAYYTHQDEITADQWLLMNSPKGSRVYADEFARRKMITYSNSIIFAQPVLVPAAIPVDSYVYLSNGNTTFNEIPLYYNGKQLSDSVPYSFLNNNKNLLYNSGSVLIYK